MVYSPVMLDTVYGSSLDDDQRAAAISIVVVCDDGVIIVNAKVNENTIRGRQNSESQSLQISISRYL
jgi:hypothetical protein